MLISRKQNHQLCRMDPLKEISKRYQKGNKITFLVEYIKEYEEEEDQIASSQNGTEIQWYFRTCNKDGQTRKKIDETILTQPNGNIIFHRNTLAICTIPTIANNENKEQSNKENDKNERRNAITIQIRAPTTKKPIRMKIARKIIFLLQHLNLIQANELWQYKEAIFHHFKKDIKKIKGKEKKNKYKQSQQRSNVLTNFDSVVP